MAKRGYPGGFAKIDYGSRIIDDDTRKAPRARESDRERERKREGPRFTHDFGARFMTIGSA